MEGAREGGREGGREGKCVSFRSNVRGWPIEREMEGRKGGKEGRKEGGREGGLTRIDVALIEHDEEDDVVSEAGETVHGGHLDHKGEDWGGEREGGREGERNG
jgi:hypothetical protein